MRLFRRPFPVKDAEAVLFGLDDITETDTVVFVEGECDKLACEEAGFLNVVSVPNGAQAHNEVADDSVAFRLSRRLCRIPRSGRAHHLAVDADENGRALRANSPGASAATAAGACVGLIAKMHRARMRTKP